MASKRWLFGVLRSLSMFRIPQKLFRFAALSGIRRKKPKVHTNLITDVIAAFLSPSLSLSLSLSPLSLSLSLSLSVFGSLIHYQTK
jgi:hypothetical protein